LAEGLFKGGGVDGDVGEEIAMGAVMTVIGLARGHGEKLFDAPDVKMEEESAVKNEGVAEAALGVPGKLKSV